MPRPSLHILLTTSYILVTTIFFAQPANTQPTFKNFINQFPTVQLPDTIQYAADEFDYGYGDPDEDDDEDSPEKREAEKDTTRKYKNSVLPKPDSLIISDKLVQEFFLGDSEHLFIYLPEYGPDTVHPVYYFSKRLLTNQDFHCVVYEKQFVYAGTAYCQKYLCTLTKKGKLISKIKVASADYSGTGIMGGGLRIPWFPDEKSIVSKELTIYYFKQGIHFTGDAVSGKTELNPEVVYQVDESGKIKRAGRKK